MITSKEELKRVTKEWMRYAKNDLRERFTMFMAATGFSIRQVANLLNVPEEQISDIINGNGDINISTFAKILIATDSCIEIKPIKSINDSYPLPQDMPMCGGRPMPMDGRRPMPMSGRPMPMDGERPMPMGENEYGSINIPDINGSIANRRKLIEEIVENRWENNGIDLINSSDNELIDFINQQKNSSRATNVQRDNVVRDDDNNTELNIEDVVNKIKTELNDNPQLMELFKKFM